MGIEEVKDSDRMMDRRQRIARESLELTYRWDNKGIGKTEISGFWNIVE